MEWSRWFGGWRLVALAGLVSRNIQLLELRLHSRPVVRVGQHIVCLLCAKVTQRVMSESEEGFVDLWDIQNDESAMAVEEVILDTCSIPFHAL